MGAITVCRDVLPTSLVLVGKDIELDAVGRQFVPYPYLRMRLHAGGAFVVWPGMLFPNSRIKAAAKPAFCL